MDGKWSGNNFLLGFNSLANHITIESVMSIQWMVCFVGTVFLWPGGAPFSRVYVPRGEVLLEIWECRWSVPYYCNVSP
jgi:hypothetical protein